MNYRDSFITENKFKSHEKVCNNKDLFGIGMQSQKNNVLKFKRYMKSDKMPYVIYADTESLIKRKNRWICQ